MKKIIFLPISLLIACSSGTFNKYPPEVKSYSETVMVPGMSYEDLNLKLIIFQSKRGGFTYSADVGKYTARFDIQSNSPSEINERRNMAYAKAAELRKAVYSIPLLPSEEENLLEEAIKRINNGRESEAKDILYKITIANPQAKPALILYAKRFEYNELYDDAIRILEYAQNEKGVPEHLAKIRAIKQERDEREAAIKADESARRQQEAMRRNLEREAERQQNWDSSSNILSNLYNKNNKSNNASSSYTSSQTQTSVGGSAKDCTNYYNICNHAESNKNKAENTLKDLKSQGAKSSKITSARSTFNDAKKHLNKVQSDAKAAGCRCP